MRDDEEALVVCHPITAKYLLSKDANIKQALVITEVVPVDELTVVPQAEFLAYLNEGLNEN